MEGARTYLIGCLLFICFSQGLASPSLSYRHIWDQASDHEFLNMAGEVILENPEIIGDIITDLRLSTSNVLAEEFKDAIKDFAAERVDKCNACERVVQALKLIAIAIGDYEKVASPVQTICKIVINRTSPDTNAEILCPGTMDLYGPYVLDVLQNWKATGAKICRNFNVCHGHIIRTLGRKPRPVGVSSHTKAKKTTKRRERRQKELIKIAHLADIHVDPHYAIGSPSDCGLPACCHTEYPGTGVAGNMGSLGCNVPQRTVEYFFNKTKEMNPDFIIYTGDNPPHHPWEETAQVQTECNQLVYESMNRTIGDYHVYLGLGNHESHPTNLYYLRNEFGKDLQANVANWWAPLTKLNEAEMETLKEASYYSAMTPIPNLRILSINTQFWYVLNFYNALNEGTVEIINMLTFIEDTLAEAERNGEKVLVMMHHPVGEHEVITMYSQWYKDIVLRYHHTIILQVAGHTHQDHFKLFSDPLSGVANNLLLVNPSITARSGSGNVNPSMRMYYLDPDTLELVDFEQYRMYLDDTTVVMPDIEFVYSAKEAYSLPDMSPVSWQNLVNSFETNDRLFEAWWTNRCSDAERGEKSICDADCKRKEICLMKNPSYDDYLACEAQ